tara:strand:+ start:4042 stop:5100 length:1059 start_codon:yes stop_codon:yes gene_type:complete
MIGYYAHQHGSGHLNFARLFAKVFGDEICTFSSLKKSGAMKGQFVQLADENPDGTASEENQIAEPDYLHYSPVGQRSIQLRSAQILKEVVERNIKLMIVDVSVEIAALMRSSSIPYAYVKLPGHRDDAAHVQAFQGAVFVLAYYPEEFESEQTPVWLRKKTIYLGFITDRKIGQQITAASEEVKNILVISGGGGNERLLNAINVLPERFISAEIRVIGMPKESFSSARIKNCGYVQNFQNLLEEADLVVANCGLNSVTEILQAKKAFVAIPEERPYREQETTATHLYETDLAIDLNSLFDLEDSEILEHKTLNVDDELRAIKKLKDQISRNYGRLPLVPQLFANQPKQQHAE